MSKHKIVPFPAECAPDFKDPSVQSALKNYEKELLKLHWDVTTTKGRDLIESSAGILDSEHQRLKKLLKEVNSPDGYTAICDKKNMLITARITSINRALAKIKNERYEVIHRLHGPAQQTLKALRNAPSRGKEKELIALEHEVSLHYDASRGETKRRYEPMDYWYAIGNEHAISLRNSEDRAYQLALIPKPVQDAKWEFILALADSAYHIFTPPNHTSPMQADKFISPNAEHKVIAQLLSRLSINERGATNPTMGEAYKLRHNPAIHSLHTVALIDKIFHHAWQDIAFKHPRESQQTKYREQWVTLRQHAMIMALVHDMGEIDGELSCGNDRSLLPSEQREVFNKERKADEEKTFFWHLNDVLKMVDIKPDKKSSLCAYLGAAFHEIEKKDTFISHVVKVLEQMQSQQDYLRFEGKDNATKLQDTVEDDKKFSMNYVSLVLRGANFDEPENKGKSLNAHLSKGNQAYMEVCNSLTKATYEEYEHIIKELQNAFGVKRNPVLVGGRAH